MLRENHFKVKEFRLTHESEAECPSSLKRETLTRMVLKKHRPAMPSFMVHTSRSTALGRAASASSFSQNQPSAARPVPAYRSQLEPVLFRNRNLVFIKRRRQHSDSK